MSDDESDICRMPVKPSLITTVDCILFVLTKEGRMGEGTHREREREKTGHQK